MSRDTESWNHRAGDASLARLSPLKALRGPPVGDNNEIHPPALCIPAAHFSSTCKKLFLSPGSQRELSHLLDLTQQSWGQNSGPFNLANATSAPSVLRVSRPVGHQKGCRGAGKPPPHGAAWLLTDSEGSATRTFLNPAISQEPWTDQLAKSKVHRLRSFLHLALFLVALNCVFLPPWLIESA